jgi:hypothetical protein
VLLDAWLSREMDTGKRWISLLIAGLLLTAAAVLVMVGTGGDPLPQSVSESAPVSIVPADPTEVYDPVEAGEELPRGYRPLLGRDQIEPVYNPRFTTSGEVDWPRESLVIGVAGEETAKAYPVTHLNSREMVIDSLEGIPILVTW